jgi:hypothetical protein
LLEEISSRRQKVIAHGAAAIICGPLRSISQIVR